ncbi:MAG: hypothetical protein E7030_00945 [Akkermansiaceae bacterium]|nr:hypothetical protein [Akkermansiaceae bacterium]
MKIFQRIKERKESRYYFCGIMIYSRRRVGWFRETTIMGITLKKNLKNKKIIKAEQRIFKRAKIYDASGDEKNILCFDCLSHPYAEAIDAWSLFQYLKKMGKPVFYVILKKNALYDKLLKKGQLDGIIGINSEEELILQYGDIIRKTNIVFCSYGYAKSDLFSKLSTLKYVFIEHGVTLLKKIAMDMYYDKEKGLFDYMLTPTKLTLSMYEQYNVMHGRRICTGMPRWDNLLKNAPHETKNVFLFFTWRYSFLHNVSTKQPYFKRLQVFIDSLVRLVEKKTDIKVFIGVHHMIYSLKSSAEPVFKGVELVDTAGISEMIKKADLFITDYSSVCFDLMYSDVPVIFYRHDADVVYADQRDNDALISAKDSDSSLYNIFYDVESTLQQVKYYIEHDFELEKDKKEINKNIFWEKGNNCQNLINIIEQEDFR